MASVGATPRGSEGHEGYDIEGEPGLSDNDDTRDQHESAEDEGRLPDNNDTHDQEDSEIRRSAISPHTTRVEVHLWLCIKLRCITGTVHDICDAHSHNVIIFCDWPLTRRSGRRSPDSKCLHRVP